MGKNATIYPPTQTIFCEDDYFQGLWNLRCNLTALVTAANHQHPSDDLILIDGGTLSLRAEAFSGLVPEKATLAPVRAAGRQAGPSRSGDRVRYS